jgi:type IV pilus biogenesis protein CpaD/CtpE
MEGIPMNATPLRVIALAASLFLAGCLGPGTPEEQLEVIQEMLAKNLPVTDQQKTDMDALIAKGREALEGGKKDEATAAFDKVLAILKIAEDAALFNKAD